MMKQHKDFANFVYANFAKPIANKTMLTILDISNEMVLNLIIVILIHFLLLNGI